MQTHLEPLASDRKGRPIYAGSSVRVNPAPPRFMPSFKPATFRGIVSRVDALGVLHLRTLEGTRSAYPETCTVVKVRESRETLDWRSAIEAAYRGATKPARR